MARITTGEKNRTKATRAWVAAGLVLGGTTLALLTGTTPDRVGPIGITVFFLLLSLTLFCLGMWLRSVVLAEPKSTSLLVVILASTLPVGALALNTIDLQIGEILLLFLFSVTLIIYWTKLR